MLVALGQSLTKLDIFNYVNARYHIEALNVWHLSDQDLIASDFVDIFAVFISKILTSEHLLLYTVDMMLDLTLVRFSLLFVRGLDTGCSSHTFLNGTNCDHLLLVGILLADDRA